MIFTRSAFFAAAFSFMADRFCRIDGFCSFCSVLAVNSLNACSRLSASLALKITIQWGGADVLSLRRVKSTPYRLAQGLNAPMFLSVISMLDRAAPCFLSCFKLCSPWRSVFLPFLRASKYFLMAACSTSAVNFVALMDRATVFWFTSSCNRYPSFAEAKRGRQGKRKETAVFRLSLLNPHPQAGKVVGPDPDKIPVVGHFYAGRLPPAACQYVKTFPTVQPAVIVGQIKTNVVTVGLLVKYQCALFHGSFSFQILPLAIS